MFKDFFKKADIILLAALLIAGAAASFAVARSDSGGKTDGAYVVITLAGKECGRYPLADDAQLTVRTDGTVEESKISAPEGEGAPSGGYNIVQIKDGKVTVTEADCRSQVCVDHAPISKSGESIICLPHRLVVSIESVSIESGEGGGYDTIAQ